MYKYLINSLLNEKRMMNDLPVTNEFFGILNKIQSTSNRAYEFSKKETNEFDSSKKNIVVILESPHRSEYDDNGIPIRSANGKSGVNLSRKLADKINVAINNKLCTLNEAKYNVYVINAIQYQCSLGLKPIQPELRNCIFRIFWPILKDDFIKRVKTLEPVLIINMCTGGVNSISEYNKNTGVNAPAQNKKEYIKKIIKEELPLNLMVHVELDSLTPKYDCLYCTHPSSRHFNSIEFRK